VRILILGGTVFLGRALVEAALEWGHTLTLFNRGKSNPDLFPDVEQLHGDRAADLSVLADRPWDAVIDTSGYVPRSVRQSAELLARAVDHYTFVSSLSVYADTSQAGVDETAPVGTLADPSVEQVTGDTYGPLKASCEQAVEQALPGRALIIRPGLIVGPHDPTDRFTYWPHRVAQGGEVLSPGRPARPIQFIDVRDLAEWIIRLVEAQQTGIYNAGHSARSVTMEQLLETCQTISVSDATFTWVSEQFLRENQVGEWIEMPLWVPEADPANAGFFAFDCRKAIAAGLTFRLLQQTVRATLDWDATRPGEHAWRAGVTREREAELLQVWRLSQAASRAIALS
jgi:2'-hydroxyisoflavone reductase